MPYFDEQIENTSHLLIPEQEAPDCPSSLPKNSTISERMQEKEIHRLLARIDLFCSETQQIEQDLQTFLTDYCTQVKPYIDQITEMDTLIESCKIIQPRTPENRPKNQQIRAYISARAMLERGEIQEEELSATSAKIAQEQKQTIHQAPHAFTQKTYAHTPQIEESPSQTIAPEMQKSNANAAHKQTPGERFEQEIRALYRQLAKTFHPDLTQGDMSEQMQIANHAYASRQLGSLWRLKFEQDWHTDTLALMPPPSRAALLQDYTRKIKHGLNLVTSKCNALTRSPEYELQQNVFHGSLQGHNVMKHIIAQLKEEVSAKSRRLEYLKATGRL